ncbi:MAG: glycosyltransferase family 4 protein [Muribaculaceae bacterium]
MKIALLNYRYFISGGPERYLFNIKEVLERHGHETVVFSIKNSRNEPSPFEEYFLDSVEDSAYFAQSKKSPSMVLKSFSRMFYSFEAKRKFSKLLRDTRPDVVYMMQYHNKISPSVIDAARALHIPVVHRISDMQYMCPNALFYTPARGICDDCLRGKRRSCIKQKCVLNSRIYSAIKAGAKLFHDIIGVTRRIDAFVVPARFTAQRLAEYGIPQSKLNHVPTFFNIKEQDPPVEYQPYALYFGRIEPAKGLTTLVNAFVDTDMELKIIGACTDDYIDTLKAMLQGRKHNIQFLGEMPFDRLKEHLRRCRFCIVPSECYDNFPNVVLESFAFKKPVVATDLGSLPELIEEGTTGHLFKYRDADMLRRISRRLMLSPDECIAMGNNAYQLILTKYNPETHYNALMNIFSDVIASNKHS